jgi:hypothetical protein
MKAQELIVALMDEVQSLAKKEKNQSQGFNFRGIDAVMNVVGPALRKHGGFIVPVVVDKSHEIVQGANGKSLNYARLTVTFCVYGDDAQYIAGTVAAEAFDSGDKATAKAMSVAYRTFLLQLLCLPTDEPDPDTYSYELGNKTAKADRDWATETEALTDIDAARQLYAEARTHKAGDAVLKAIESKVAKFAPASTQS